MLSRSALLCSPRWTRKVSQYQISQLSNGLRVITAPEGSGTAGVGFFSLNGAKFEVFDKNTLHNNSNSNNSSNSNNNTLGSAAVFEHFPFCKNLLYSEAEVANTIGVFGNAFRVVNNKEALGILLMCPQQQLKEALSLLNGMALHPDIHNAQEFEIGKEKVKQRFALQSRDASSILFNKVHEAGWGNGGLGNPMIPPPEVMDTLHIDNFANFYKTHTRPERCVVAAVGVYDHLSFCEDCEKMLNFDDFILKGMEKNFTPRTSSSSSTGYTGGMQLLANTAAPESLNKFQEKNLSHFGIFFQGVPMRHPHYYTYSVIQTLLGGGASFSSGGPGKGMQTKLFREVLNKEYNVNSLECITAWYSDGGLLGLYGTAPHEHADYFFNTVMLRQAASIAERVTEYHLHMAINQLGSQLILLGEGREQLLSDLGFNCLVHDNFVVTAENTLRSFGSSGEDSSSSLNEKSNNNNNSNSDDGAKDRHSNADSNSSCSSGNGADASKSSIHGVTLQSLKEVAAEMMSKPVTIAAYGEISCIPSYEKVQATLRELYWSMKT